jgi:hypothetical protein
VQLPGEKVDITTVSPGQALNEQEAKSMVPELVLATEKLGQNDVPGKVDTVVDGD